MPSSFRSRVISPFLILSLLFSLFSPLSEAKFVDEDEFPSWAEDAIELVNEKRIMTGYGDGRFAPDELLNRAQAVTLLLRIKAIDAEEDDGESGFDDVPSGAWYRKAVSSSVKRGWIKGRGHRRFDPEANLTRAEWAAMVARVFELDLNHIEGEHEYYDVPARVWFTPYVYAMAENGLTRFPNTDYYRPEKLVTRAEAAWTMASILGKPRLMGTSTENDFGARRGLNHRKVSVKPRDFNANKQGYEIQKEELNISVVESEGEVLLTTNPDFSHLGTVEITNTFKDDAAELESLQFRLRFELPSVGPLTEFEVKLEGENYGETVDMNRSGEAVFTGMKMAFAPEESVTLDLFIRPKEGAFFFQKKGEGNFYIFSGGALVSRVFQSTGRRGSRYAPVGIKERDLATIIFDPMK